MLLSDQSVTAPGLSVIDVERELRPHPLPEVGDRVSAAGPVYRGSFGQRQIQATDVFTAPGSSANASSKRVAMTKHPRPG